MTEKQEGGKIQGGQVFIFSKKVRNDGKIVSTGQGAKTLLETDEYSGSGSVESHNNPEKEKNWVKNHLVMIYTSCVAAIIAGLVLFYFFGIGK